MQGFVHNPCMIDRRLQVLRMVAACGTVTGAAEALHYTPSAVSHQLRRLKDLALVKDFLSGIFMIFEDQYGVGDEVDLGEASGTVEAVSLRVTRLRDVNGLVSRDSFSSALHHPTGCQVRVCSLFTSTGEP